MIVKSVMEIWKNKAKWQPWQKQTIQKKEDEELDPAVAKKCRRKLEQVKEAARRWEASENARHTQRSSKKIKIGWNMPNGNWPYDKNSTHGCQSSTSFGGSFDCFAENLKSKSKLKEN